MHEQLFCTISAFRETITNTICHTLLDAIIIMLLCYTLLELGNMDGSLLLSSSTACEELYIFLYRLNFFSLSILRLAFFFIKRTTCIHKIFIINWANRTEPLIAQLVRKFLRFYGFLCFIKFCKSLASLRPSVTFTNMLVF